MEFFNKTICILLIISITIIFLKTISSQNIVNTKGIEFSRFPKISW